jgi:alpha-ketoglutarate-dependent taurine dioxygenase
MVAGYLNAVELIQSNPSEDICGWMGRHTAEVRDALVARGAILLRGFHGGPPNLAELALGFIGNELLDDAFWSTPRSEVSLKTFTATEYPRARTIGLHSEMAYMPAWPRLIAFHSLDVAAKGGETTICDIDAVSRELGSLLEKFDAHGVLYRRTYHPGVDVPWQKAFRTSDRDEVRTIAERTGMQTRWLDGDILQTTHSAQGCVTTEDDRRIWFNQAHLFHPANLLPAQLESLVELFGRDRLPRTAVYGDGSEISADTIHRVNKTFNDLALGVAWQPGDLLILDNMRFAHGRMPFEGTRKVHVALANQQSIPRRTPLFAGA